MTLSLALSSSTIGDLAQIARGGGPDAALAEEELIKRNEGLVRAAVRHVTRATGPLDEDLLQEARIGLLLAIRRYNPLSSASLSTFAWPSIHGAVVKAIRASFPKQCKKTAAAVSRRSSRRQKAHPQQMPLFDERYAVQDAVMHLSPEERRLLMSIYWRGESQVAIAKRLSLSHTAIQKRQRRALEHARRALQAS